MNEFMKHDGMVVVYWHENWYVW